MSLLLALTGGLSAVVGQATETDAAQSVARIKIRAAAQSAETETAQSLTHQKRVSVGQAVESDTAQSITAGGAAQQIIAVGQASESDAALAVAVASASVSVGGRPVYTSALFALRNRRAQLRFLEEPEEYGQLRAAPIAPPAAVAPVLVAAKPPQLQAHLADTLFDDESTSVLHATTFRRATLVFTDGQPFAADRGAFKARRGLPSPQVLAAFLQRAA